MLGLLHIFERDGKYIAFDNDMIKCFNLPKHIGEMLLALPKEKREAIFEQCIPEKVHSKRETMILRWILARD